MKIELVGCFAGLISTITQIPQLEKIYRTNNTDDLSIYTYLLLLLASILWLIYGYFRKSLSLILFNIFQIILFILIIFEINKKNYINIF